MGIAGGAASVLIFAAACANASSSATDARSGGSEDGPGSGGPTQCPTGELATDVGPTGQVTCAPVDAPALAAIDAGCSVYFGWRDDCDGCTTAPLKWGRIGGEACISGAGATNTCTTQSLGGDAIRLFGLDPDGDIDGNDKFYGSLHCAAGDATSSVAPCKAGEFVTSTYGSSWTCAPLAVAVIDYIRDHCSLYLGWQDNCDGCTTAPAKWGHASSATCANGAGADNTCSTAMLGGESINLFGLNPDGNVDGNDKLHIGLRCTTPAPASAPSTSTCPPGQFVVGTLPDGSFQCESAAPLVVQAFTDHCSIHFGWRDDCNGCTSPPTKWGTARVGACANGAGADNTCTSFTLGENAVHLFGLNMDGDADGNDLFSVGFACRSGT